MADAIIAVLGVLGGLIKAVQAVVEFVHSRLRDVPMTTSVNVRGLETEPERYPDQGELRQDSAFGYVFVLLGILLSGDGAAILFSWVDLGMAPPREEVVGGLLLLEGLALSVVGAHRIAGMRGAVPGQALQTFSVRLSVCGTLTQAVDLCVAALIAIGGIQSAGSGVTVDDSAGTATIWGGTGSWPKNARGSKVTVFLRQKGDESCAIEVRSETFRTALLDRRANRRNVSHVVQKLLIGTGKSS